MINDVLNLFLNVIRTGFKPIQAYSMKLTYILLAIDIGVFFIYMALGKNQDLGSIVEKIITISVMLWIIKNFAWLSNIFADSVMKVTSLVSHSKISGFDTDYFTNPSGILEFGTTQVLQPMGKLIDSFKAPGALFPDIKLCVIGIIAEIAVLACFSTLTLQLVIASIEFYISVLMSLVLVPFIIFEPLRFIGSKTFSTVIGHAMKCGMASLIAGVGTNVFKTLLLFQPGQAKNWDAAWGLYLQYLVLLLVSSILLVYLAIQIPELASSFISGVPNLSASGVLGLASATLGAVINKAQDVGDATHTAGVSAKTGIDNARNSANGDSGSGGSGSGSGRSNGTESSKKEHNNVYHEK